MPDPSTDRWWHGGPRLRGSSWILPPAVTGAELLDAVIHPDDPDAAEAARVRENELLQRIVDCLDPPCFLWVPAGGTLHDPHGQEVYWADGEEDELLLLAKPLVLNLFDEWGHLRASAAPASANPYRHDHNPLNADIHGGICSACEWERDEAAASSASGGAAMTAEQTSEQVPSAHAPILQPGSLMCVCGEHAVAHAPVTPRAVTPGWTWANLLGTHQVVNGEPLPAMALLGYPDGRIAFRHVCDRGDRGLIVCAPFLQLENGGHQLVSRYLITITPSIFCPDCGTHGFVTNGEWRSA